MMMIRTPLGAFSLALLAAFGAPGTAPLPGDTKGAGDVTFTEHVAPIVFHNCTPCHRPGEATPFTLMNYEEARRRGRMMALVTEQRIMPPWPPVAGHGDFLDARNLTGEQIATLRRWVEGGMPEGDPTKLPALPAFPDGWQLGEPDLVVRMEEEFVVPADGPDIYRRFRIPLGLDEDRWLAAVEVRPSPGGALHHMRISHTGDTPEGGGLGNIGSETQLWGWALGQTPHAMPLGLAGKLPKGADLELVSHFHPIGKEARERTTLGLHFTDRPPTRTMVALHLPPMFGLAGIDIPAGERDFPLEDSFVLPAAFQVVSVGGHAHFLCRTMKATATLPDGRVESLFYIDNWAFDWQGQYQYREPIDLPAGTRIDVVITYDNSNKNPSNPHDPPERVGWGLQTTEEMGSITLFGAAVRETETGALVKGYRGHSRKILQGPGAAKGRASLLVSRVRMLDTNLDGRIDKSEIPAKARKWTGRLDKNKDGEIDASELEHGP